MEDVAKYLCFWFLYAMLCIGITFFLEQKGKLQRKTRGFRFPRTLETTYFKKVSKRKMMVSFRKI